MLPNLTICGEKIKPQFLATPGSRCSNSQEVISPINPLIYPDYESLSRSAANFIRDQLQANPALLLCAATGETPTWTYDLLAAQPKHEQSMFDNLRILKLDEWGGLAMDDPGSCEMYLQQHLIQPLGIPEDRYIGFYSDAADAVLECRRIRDELEKQSPIDLCVLGLGANGHLALNEPADELCPHVHVARLSEQSLKHSMLSHSRQPRYGLTLGMADILQSTTILLLVSGEHKRNVLQRLLSGPISTRFPASFLWLHSNLTVMCDMDASRAVV